jgi:mono/diheme cytochrome c family protein
MHRVLAAVMIATAAAGAACDERLSDAGPTSNLEPTFSSIQRDIFQAGDSAGRVSCATCHNPAGGAFRQVGLDLGSEGAYNSLVGVPSVQRPGVLRVAPGDPDNSYLMHKIEGRPGITGLRMPRNPPFMTDGQIRIIRRWIEIGAPRN